MRLFETTEALTEEVGMGRDIHLQESRMLILHLFQKKHYGNLMDLTDVFYYLGKVQLLRSSAELLMKAASIEKNIRITTLLSNLVAPDPLRNSVYSTSSEHVYRNPILEGEVHGLS